MVVRFLLAGLALILVGGCAGVVDQSAIPGAQAQNDLALTQCAATGRVGGFKSAGDAMECQIAADRAFVTAIRLKRMDIFDAYVARVRLMGQQADSGVLTVGKAWDGAAQARTDMENQIILANNTDVIERQQAAAAMAGMGQALQQAGASMQSPTPAAGPVLQPIPIYQPQNCRTVFVGSVANTQCY